MLDVANVKHWMEERKNSGQIADFCDERASWVMNGWLFVTNFGHG